MKTLIFFSLIIASLSSFAKEGGNGGGVHVCGKKMELYDFFEGRDSRGHNIPVWESNKKVSFEAYLQKALNHIDADIPEVSGVVKAMVQKILATPKKDLFVNIYIPHIFDATITVIGEGCFYKQAANWNERFHTLFISEEVFKKLDPMNQAGLIIHEAVYKLSRETKVAVETSDAVREVVARIFSDEKLTKKEAEVISSSEALILASKPSCELVKQHFAEIDKLMKGKETADSKSFVKNNIEFCLKYCLIPEERAACEKRR